MVDRSYLGEARKRPIICFLILLLLVPASTPVLLSAGSSSVAQSTRLGHESSAARPSRSASAPVVAGEAEDGSGAAVWTDKQDYSPEQTVTIYGAGFAPGAAVTVTVVRPDGSVNPPPWIVTADGSGGFTPPTTYQLDGISGTYTVTASDGTNTATTTFTDAVTFDVTITPFGTITSQTTSYTITITSTGTTSIGSVKIAYGTPNSWGTPASTTLAVSGKSWSVGTGGNAPSAGTLYVYATGTTDVLATSNVLTIAFSITAPSTAGWYDVTVTAYSARTWSGSGSVTQTRGVAVYDPASPKVSVQLAFILDGSGSIGQSNFNIALQGLAAAIRDPATVPQDGSVELTIIEFGDSILAKVEVMPVVITSQTVANTIADLLCQGTNCSTHALEYLGGYTPTASAIYLATDILKASPNYADWKRQAINLVTDGGPNACPISDTDRYHAIQCDSDSNGGPNGRAAAQAALAYARTTLAMTPDKDEFDAEFIGTDATCNDCPSGQRTTNSEWLRASIVWPEQSPGNGGYIVQNGVFDKGPGWVRKISDWTQFADTVKAKFKMVLKLGLTVAKQVNGGSKVPGDFTLYVKDSSGTNVAGSPFQGSLGGTTFSDLPAGTYTVSETQISGYSLAISGDCDQTTGQVTLSGSNKQCTFTNNYGGPWLKIVKNSGDDDGNGFGFTVTGPSSPTKSIDTHFGTGTTDFFPIDPSSPGNLYTVAETNMPGWALVSSSCTKATGGASFSPQGFAVSSGDSITCTFTDTKRGHIIVDKVTNPSPDPTNIAFGFTLTGGPDSLSQSFSLTDAATPYDSGAVKPGTYAVEETTPLPSGWDLTSATCTGTGNTPSSISLAAGDAVTCTFTDTMQATPTIATLCFSSVDYDWWFCD